jgi:hypothetical protein
MEVKNIYPELHPAEWNTTRVVVLQPYLFVTNTGGCTDRTRGGIGILFEDKERSSMG